MKCSNLRTEASIYKISPFHNKLFIDFIDKMHELNVCKCCYRRFQHCTAQALACSAQC